MPTQQTRPTQPTPYREHLARMDRIKRALTRAQRQRDDRPEVLTTPHGTMLAWNLFEIQRVHAAVDAERAVLGKAPIDLDRVIAADQMACGHADYTTKFALYAADLVEGD